MQCLQHRGTRRGTDSGFWISCIRSGDRAAAEKSKEEMCVWWKAPERECRAVQPVHSPLQKNHFTACPCPRLSSRIAEWFPNRTGSFPSLQTLPFTPRKWRFNLIWYRLNTCQWRFWEERSQTDFLDSCPKHLKILPCLFLLRIIQAFTLCITRFSSHCAGGSEHWRLYVLWILMY